MLDDGALFGSTIQALIDIDLNEYKGRYTKKKSFSSPLSHQILLLGPLKVRLL